MDRQSAEIVIERCKEIIGCRELFDPLRGQGALNFQLMWTVGQVWSLLDGRTDPKDFPKEVKDGLLALSIVANRVLEGGIPEKPSASWLQRLGMSKMQRINEGLSKSNRREAMKYKDVIDRVLALGELGRNQMYNARVVAYAGLTGGPLPASLIIAK